MASCLLLPLSFIVPLLVYYSHISSYFASGLLLSCLYVTKKFFWYVIFSAILPLGRFHLIIPEIRILSSGNEVSEFLFPFNHLYQVCSGPGPREVPVDTFQQPKVEGTPTVGLILKE